jgi:hypothetical protein
MKLQAITLIAALSVAFTSKSADAGHPSFGGGNNGSQQNWNPGYTVVAAIVCSPQSGALPCVIRQSTLLSPQHIKGVRSISKVSISKVYGTFDSTFGQIRVD